MDEHPGPPFTHKASGAVAGLFRDSKNQKNMLMFAASFVSRCNLNTGQLNRVHTAHRQIARVLVYTRSCLTDTRVCHIVNLCSSRLVLENGMRNAVSYFYRTFSPEVMLRWYGSRSAEAICCRYERQARRSLAQSKVHF